MRARGPAALMLFVLAAGCGGDGPSGPPPGGGTPVPNATVVAGAASNTFTPTRVDLTRNGTVTWTFGGLAHNVAFGGTGAPADIGDTTNANVSRTFPNAGTFAYTCTLHAGMSGSVVVQ